MNGPIFKELATDESLSPLINKNEKLNLRIVACEFAMKYLGVTKAQFSPFIETTPNALTYLFGLQENGFKTITL